MEEHGALVNLGELSKPATALIEKVSEGIGGLLAPWQMVRMARGEVAAAKIRAKGALELTEGEEFIFRSTLARETKEQRNILAIVAKAIPDLSADSEPSKIDSDWVAEFSHLFRRTSQEEMQALWGRLLATEANQPGSFSKRTLHVVSVLERRDAELFGLLCALCVEYENEAFPLVYNFADPFYQRCGLDEKRLNDLEDLDLISISMENAVRVGETETAEFTYFGQRVLIPTNGKTFLDTGRVLLTRAGNELYRVSGAGPLDGFMTSVVPKLSPRQRTQKN